MNIVLPAGSASASFRYNEEDVAALRRRIDVLVKSRRVTQTVLANQCKVADAVFSKWKSGHKSWNSLKEPAFLDLIDYLQRERLLLDDSFYSQLVDGFPLSPFHAWAQFYGVTENEIRACWEKVQGVYRIYRPSTLCPGRYLVGRLSIDPDPKTFSIRTEEHYKNEKEEFGVVFDKIMKGYFIPKDRYYLIFAEPFERDVQIKYIRQGFAGESAVTEGLPGGAQREPPAPSAGVTASGKIRRMLGSVMDMADNVIYSAPIYLERICKPEIVEPGVASFEELPVLCRSHFQASQADKSTLFAFF